MNVKFTYSFNSIYYAIFFYKNVGGPLDSPQDLTLTLNILIYNFLSKQYL